MNHLNFSQERYKRIKENYGKWWQGKSDRAIMGFALDSHSFKGKQPKAPLLSQATVDLTTPIDDILDTIEYRYSAFEYLGDAYPNFNLDCFGPGVLAAFLGATLDNKTGRVWFYPGNSAPIDQLDFKYDEDSPWFRRVIDFVSRGYERFEGQMIFSMPDLGGILDVLSVFLPGESLLLCLYDEPQLVLKLIKQLDELWIKYYRAIAEAAKSDQIGYTDWSGVYSSDPSYIIQCDFSYMISNDMFKRFALPSLEYSCDKITNTIYHLDGVNELNHLDDICGIKNLNCIQWVHGAGQKPIEQWGDVYKKILNSGKLAYMLNCGPQSMEKIADEVGGENKMVYQFTLPSCVWDAKDKEYLIKYLRRFNVEV